MQKKKVIKIQLIKFFHKWNSISISKPERKLQPGNRVKLNWEPITLNILATVKLSCQCPNFSKFKNVMKISDSNKYFESLIIGIFNILLANKDISKYQTDANNNVSYL